MADEQTTQEPQASEQPAAQPAVTDEAVNQPTPVPESNGGITLDQLVSIAIEQDASDIHFGEGSRIALRGQRMGRNDTRQWRSGVHGPAGHWLRLVRGWLPGFGSRHA